MSDLELSNVVTISVAETPAGVGELNTSNLALFTREVYDPDSFGAGTYKIYLEPTSVGVDFGTTSDTYKMALAVFSQQPNILAGGGYLVIIPFQSSETLDAAITRMKDTVQFFGVAAAEILSQTVALEAAAVVQPLDKLLFIVSQDAVDFAPNGTNDLVRQAGYDQARCLYYGDLTETDALVFMAAYASRLLSVDFSGSNTTITMHLKDLKGVLPDSTMTQTYLQQCGDSGTDVYISLQGVPKVFTSGANSFADRVYNRVAFVSDLRVAAFNFLAQASTKIPQTEDGMSAFKGSLRKVCEQYVRNQYLAPGSWTDPTTFGVLADFLANIEQRGYYLYSAPVSQQLQTDRAARKAPLCQLAVKEAGAIHSAAAIININA